MNARHLARTGTSIARRPDAGSLTGRMLFHHDIAPRVVLEKSASGEPPGLFTAGGSEDTLSHVPGAAIVHRILIVDDHPDAAQALAMVVRLLGHECVAVTTGGDAIALARTQDFDVAIIDIGLPDVSGHEVARELRRLPAGRAMYLAAVSGFGQPEDRTHALQAGFDHHVLKPLDVAVVRRIVTLAERAAAAR